MRFVLATNLLVSGVIGTGLPRRLVDGAKADVIASGDKRDLWPMGSFQGIPILAPAEAVTVIGAMGKT